MAGRCPGGYPKGRLQKQGSYMSYGTYQIAATDEANLLTGYWSNNASCCGLENCLRTVPPGTVECRGIHRQLTIQDIWGNACSENASKAESFCNSITDGDGNHKTPLACGGTDPEVFTSDPVTIGQVKAAEEAKVLQDEANDEVANQIATARKKILTITIVVVVLVIICALIFKF